MAALEARRFEAARLFTQGKSQATVMRRLRVSRQTAHRWYHIWRRRGRQGLKAVVLRPPEHHGFSTELWTLPRVAAVIERLTGVHYHAGHVWYILRGLHWSLQRPARQARERDEAAIRRWIAERWPAVKKTPDVCARGSSSKTKVESRSTPSSAARGRRAAPPRS